jgi:hypothetical protein
LIVFEKLHLKTLGNILNILKPDWAFKILPTNISNLT